METRTYILDISNSWLYQTGIEKKAKELGISIAMQEFPYMKPNLVRLVIIAPEEFLTVLDTVGV